MALGIKKVSFFTVTLSSMIIWVGFYTWRIMFNNFAVEGFEATATDVGAIQAAREIPGLLAFGVGFLALHLTESRIAAMSIIVLGLGLILSGLSSSLMMLGLATVFMSFGFHYFEPTNSAQLLMLSKPGELGKTQGRLRSFESMAGLGGAGLVLILTLFLDYRETFYLIGAMVLVAGLYLVVALPTNRAKTEKRKVHLKKKYRLYYALAFLRGCRRHIFTTFAIFLLVKDYELSITAVSALMLANNLITIFTNRWIGIISDRHGERIVLVFSSFTLVLIFLGYAYVSWLPLLITLYFLDHILFGSSIALKSYLRQISTTEDLTGCLSFGMTANHVTAVVVPILGGAAWMTLGHEATFVGGAVIVLIDALLALKIPKSLKGASVEGGSSGQ